MRSTAWTLSGLALALFGPGLVALAWKQATAEAVSVVASAPWLIAFALLVAAVAAIGVFAERLAPAELGFGRISWVSLPLAAALTLFLVAIFGPLAAFALARSGLGGFEAEMRSLAALPSWYLALTGSGMAAACLSLLAFGLAHLPLWGIGASLTTLVSGALFTALYLWRRDISFLILAHVATDLYGLVLTPRAAG